MTDWPAAIPTKAVLDTLEHVIEHYHTLADGSRMHPRDHFTQVLKEEIGMDERGPAPARKLAAGR